jgi:hypothetical protein
MYDLIEKIILPLLPVLLLIFTGIGSVVGWYIKSKIETNKLAKEELIKERTEKYLELLEPFHQLWSEIDGSNKKYSKKSSKSMEMVQSPKYRKTACEVTLFGSDEVIKALNEFWQYIYKLEKSPVDSPGPLMILYGNMLLEIRKSLGNSKSKLDSKDMLRHLIKEIDEL